MEPVVQNQKTILFSLLVVSMAAPFYSAFAIENDPAKEYSLNEKHGPWMIMVATFRDVHDDKRKTEGLSAKEAANKLVHELRAKGIPAYTYAQEVKKEAISTYDRLGNQDKRVFNAQLDMVCVLAGNYPKIEDPVGQKTLGYVKRFRPKFIADPKSGAAVNPLIAQQKGPFAGAFLTINPCLNPTEIVRQKPDNEIKYLNSGIDYPLVKMPHKYTLKVATFTGKSAVPMGNSRFKGQEADFDKSIFEAGPYNPYNLARAGEDATQLTYTLRQNGAATQRAFGKDRFEAYVYHDKFQSIVTIGGFDSPDDPEIKRLVEIFRAKYKSERQGDTGDYRLTAESLSLPGADPASPPLHTWAFDPIPELIEVPHIK